MNGEHLDGSGALTAKAGPTPAYLSERRLLRRVVLSSLRNADFASGLSQARATQDGKVVSGAKLRIEQTCWLLCFCGLIAVTDRGRLSNLGARRGRNSE